ncbi:MAG: hypothetical protein EBS37_02965 [Betaproteobacteria bacterium]|nr:hypothetical protein [Betaproteobacteria bacterium]
MLNLGGRHAERRDHQIPQGGWCEGRGRGRVGRVKGSVERELELGESNHGEGPVVIGQVMD